MNNQDQLVQATMTFLQRVDLKGSEAQVFLAVNQWLSGMLPQDADPEVPEKKTAKK